MILLDSYWEELGHGIFLLLYVESCLLTSHSMGALYFYSNSGPGSCIGSSHYYFDCESGRVFMTPSVTSLHSAWLQTSLYILMFAFLLGAYFWNGITESERIWMDLFTYCKMTFLKNYHFPMPLVIYSFPNNLLSLQCIFMLISVHLTVLQLQQTVLWLGVVGGFTGEAPNPGWPEAFLCHMLQWPSGGFVRRGTCQGCNPPRGANPEASPTRSSGFWKGNAAARGLGPPTRGASA